MSKLFFACLLAITSLVALSSPFESNAATALGIGSGLRHSIEQARISWIKGKGVVACSATTVSADQQCEVVTAQSNASSLRDVVPGDFVRGQVVSWIEVSDSGYHLCVLSKQRAKNCERLNIPLLEGTSLLLHKTLKTQKSVLIVAFHRSPNPVPLAARQAIGQRFLDSYMAAHNLLSSRIALTGETPAALISGKPRSSKDMSGPTGVDTVGLQADPPGAGGCDDDGMCVGGGDGGSGDGGDGEMSFPPGFGNPYAVQNPVCVAACDSGYAANVAFCTKLVTARAKSLCYGGAAVVYGGCLATC